MSDRAKGDPNTAAHDHGASPRDADLDSDLGNGLRFFPRTAPATTRRRRWFFLAAWCAISGLLIWPIYPLFKSATPLVLGLPLSLAWILLAMVLMFLALLLLFLGDEREHQDAGRGQRAEQG